MICLAFSDKGDIITGDSNGSIYVWEKEGNKISSCIKHAHDVSCSTLVVLLSEQGHEKMCLMSYANNKGADQSAHPRSLISAFVIRCLDSIISLDSIAKYQDSS